MSGHSTGLAEDVRRATSVDPARCYQCGKCTAGCPMVRFMDLSPNLVMRLVQIGDGPAVERLLTSGAIWSCAGCLTCTQRCPRELDPAAVMDHLRERAYRENRVSPGQRKVLAFHQAFLDTIESDGRMSEIPLVARYKVTSIDLFSDVMLAPTMMRKGKLHVGFPRKIRGIDQVRRIFDSCRRSR